MPENAPYSPGTTDLINQHLPGLHKTVTGSRILHVIASLDPAQGGLVHGLQNSIPELNSTGTIHEVLSLDHPDAKFLDTSFFPVIHALGPSIRPWAYSTRLLPWLEKNISSYEAVIVHGLWLYHGYAVNKAIFRLKRKGSTVPKTFVMCHGMLDPYFQQSPERKLKAIRNEIYWKWIESHVINNATGILFTCEEEMNLAAQTFKTYRPKRVFNIGFGIAKPPVHTKNMDKAFYQKCAVARERGFLLFLSRIHEKKAVELLIEAYYEVYFKNHNSNNQPVPVLVIAGPGLDTDYGKKMQQLVLQAGMQEHIHFTGMLSGDAKWGAFYNCEAFVLPSHQENFGIAIAEALACGKPVLVSGKVNIWREIKKATAGIIAEDTAEGARFLLQTWKNMSPIERSVMSQNASSCFRLNFSVKPAVARLINTIIEPAE